VPLASATSRTSYAISSKIKKLYKLPDTYILYVGDINWNKNIPSLISAFAKLKDNSVHLVLVGKVFSDKPNIPDFNSVIDAINSSGKVELIHLIGYVPSHHLGGIYHAATLYCQPSWDEGFGLPILEAMKAGCPVLSSNRGSLREVGGDAASYFDPEKDNLTDSIQALLSSESKRSALIEKGLAQAKQFSWGKTAEMTRGVYLKVITQSKSKT
jgi:glycosyltransferase involved in cell wall biosynthesis